MLLGGLDHKNRSSQACSGIMIRTDGTADKWTDLAKGDVDFWALHQISNGNSGCPRRGILR